MLCARAIEALAASTHAAGNSRDHAVGFKQDGTALVRRRAAELAQ
jgi:hypothetical protein